MAALNEEEGQKFEQQESQVLSGSPSSPQKSDPEAIDKLFQLTSSGYTKREGSNELLEEVFELLVDIRDGLMKLTKSEQEKVAEEVGERPEFISLLVPFMVQVYKALSNGYELKCLCDWQFLLVTLTNMSEKLRVKLVKEKVHFEMIKQLIDLPKVMEHQELVADLVKMAMYVMLTLIDVKEVRHYISNCCYAEVLISYVPSKNFSIGKLAKIALAILYQQVDHNQAAECLTLTEADIATILKILSSESLSDKEQSEHWDVLSKSGLILALKGFCSLQANTAQFVRQGGLAAISTVLDSEEADNQENALLLLWQLSHFMGPQMFNSSADEEDLVKKVQGLSVAFEEEDTNKQDDWLALRTSLPYCLTHTLPESDEDCLTCVKTAYKHELYEECIRICEQISHSNTSYSSSTLDCITLFHGKASYHIFKRSYLAIKKIPETTPGYSVKRKACFENAMLAIKLLGISYDNKCADEEGNRLLDIATMQALPELSNFTRCLLCRSHQKKLARSHVCPRAILDDFAKACGAPGSGKAFLVNWPWQSGLSSNLKSAGQIAVKLFCQDCESVLSKSESQFLPNFFRKFYDKTNPSHIEIEQDIDYGEWMYQFCVGLIFRGMIFQYSGGRDDYLNEDEVYSIFVQCREALLSSTRGPEVSFCVAPTAATESDMASSLINMSIHHPFHFFFTQEKGMYADHQVFLHALSYNFQIGMLITSVNFSLAHWKVDESSIIAPSGGTFHVPANSCRQRVVPEALWETLLSEAIQLEREVMEQPERMTLLPLDRLLSVPATSYMKNIIDIATESKGMGKRSALQGHPKIVNYIPDEVSVSHPTGKMVLPEGHRVLLHLNTPQDDVETGNTAFVVVGDCRDYSIDTPYMIFHHYEPGLQTNYGFFFSPNTFEFAGYLPTRKPMRFLDSNLKSSTLIEQSKEIVSLVLRTKGFRNYHSLKYWLQAKRTPSVLDARCKYKSDHKCWYCDELCEICLQPTVLGPSFTDSTGRKLRFCSDDCSDIYKTKPEPQSEVFSPDDQENPNRKVPSDHKEYLHLFSSGQLEDKSGCFITSMSLCEGDGSSSFPLQQYYLNYHLRTPHYQCYYEFFVTDDFQPLESVSFTGASCNLFEHDDEEDMKQSVLSIVAGVLQRSGCSVIPDLLEKIRLYSLMRSDIAALLIGKSFHVNPTQEQSVKPDADVSSQQTPLMLTPQQLLAIYNAAVQHGLVDGTGEEEVKSDDRDETEPSEESEESKETDRKLQ